jgi:RNA polymerase sigma-70 factor (ECF subfamily)
VTTLPRPHLLLTAPSDRGLAFTPPSERGSESATPIYNRSALIAGYSELAPRVHRFVSDLLGDRTLASDATQETFVRALRKVDGLPPGTPIVPWVFGVARRVSQELQRARGRGRRVMVDTEPDDERVVDGSARSPEAALLDREALTVVARALDRLPEDRKAALLLRLDHGLAYAEIADVMGWSLAKTKVEVFRAREVLRGCFEQWRGGEP